MVLLMEPERVGNIVGLTAMGNEGAQWFGMAPFVDDEHLIQNIGDGTLFHSGMGAIRAAIANGANITYKILYNGAVAMTGGQDPFGQLDVLSLVKVLQAEGVAQVIVTTDDLSKYRANDLPPGLKVWRRERLIEAQEVLSFVPGCTVLIHDQRCAAEKRRDRKRNRIDTPLLPRRHQRAGVRGLRRLRRQEQLPLGATRSTPRSAARPASTRVRATSTSRVCKAIAPPS